MSRSSRFTTKSIAARAFSVWAGALFCLVFSSAQASETQTVSSAASLNQASSAKAANTVGSARLRVFGFQIYDATLRAQSDFRADNYEREPLSLEIAYLRDFDNTAIAERSLKEMRNVGSFTDSQAAQWLARMVQIFPDVKKGDRLIGEYTPDQGIRFVLNGRNIGDVRDTEFARLFIGIWLSPRTSEPQLRRELLGQNTR
jgi:hypothetical protein